MLSLTPFSKLMLLVRNTLPPSVNLVLSFFILNPQSTIPKTLYTPFAFTGCVMRMPCVLILSALTIAFCVAEAFTIMIRFFCSSGLAEKNCNVTLCVYACFKDGLPMRMFKGSLISVTGCSCDDVGCVVLVLYSNRKFFDLVK